ncbi:rhomboid family intramembrane serine protease [Paucisalibacillus sp. EB02]|uniref:rhomboid family protein n=1 Tax=Paucisalibacillus sp. EB02 TaxID=1347087 RepID=UPI0004B041D3|nr:rhomboid family intramembrane serine protease [Paucisalibacillus sp. EB02]
MEQKASYIMYHYAYQLTEQHGYDILYINNNVEEIWLEKYQNKTSTIIRISTTGFDWKNHLKKDIGIVFQKTRAMRKMLRGKEIEVHNVYISPHTPIDSWEILKKPMMVQEKNPIKVNIYYLSGKEIVTEHNRLEKNIAVSFEEIPDEKNTELLEQDIHQYKVDLYHKVKEKQKKEDSVFNYGKPFITYLFIAINTILFLLLEFNGGSENTSTLIEFGAKFNPLITDGEWWRILTSMFLHLGLLHFASNMLFLYYFGSLAERIFGSVRFLVIYMLAGIGGGIASFVFVANISAGASGALYGLFGAFIYFGIFHKRIFFQTIGKNIMFLLGINIIIGFSLPQLDVSAHFGGLIAGFIAAGIVHFPKKRKHIVQIFATVLYLAVILAVFSYGIQENGSSASYQLMKIEKFIQEEQYEEVIESATIGLENPGNFEAILLFQRAFAYIHLNEIQSAIEDLELSIDKLETPENLPEAYYNLAVLYTEVGNNRAEDMIKIAYEANPNDERIAKLYETLTEKKIGD